MPVTVDGNGTISGGSASVLAGSQSTASGTNVDFTSIPSWVKKLTLSGASVSTDGNAIMLVQLGTSAGFVSTGYLGGLNNSINLITNGIAVSADQAAAAVRHFQLVLTLVASNQWVGLSMCQRSDSAVSSLVGGSVTLPGTLDRLRLTTSGGTQAFDSGSVNLLYE